jgi:hypothetical protein
MKRETSISSTWNDLNGLLGKVIYTMDRDPWNDPKTFRRFAEQKYILTPEEVLKFEIPLSAGPGKGTLHPDPRVLDPTRSRDECHDPHYWLVNTPFWGGGERILIIERLSLDSRAPIPNVGYIHKLGELKNNPVIYLDPDFHKVKGTTTVQVDSLLERLSDLGIETVPTSLTP